MCVLHCDGYISEVRTIYEVLSVEETSVKFLSLRAPLELEGAHESGDETHEREMSYVCVV